MDLFKTTRVLESALSGATLKHRIISSNIANVDTPNYKSKQVSFQSALKKALGQKVLNSYRTHPKHIKFSTELEGVFTAKIHSNPNLLFNHNGNNVDMDYEMAQLAKNQIWYTALVDRTQSSFQSLKTVINEGR